MSGFRVPRRVSVMNDDPGSSAESSRWLKEYRSAFAYVLLGEPGSGKTTAFEMECAADPAGSALVSVRDFTRLDLDSHPEWRGKTLFIDALDEMRTGSGDWRQPLDAARKRLEKLGNPRFRLSCRAGEWLGEDDAAALEQLVPTGEMPVLGLDPPGEPDVRALLRKRVGEAQSNAFMKYVDEYGLRGFLQHPLHMELLLQAGIGNTQVSSRRGLFEAACKAMVREKNPAKRSLNRGIPGPTETALLNASGLLCALSLLADTSGWSLDPAEPTSDFPSSREIESIESIASAGELDAALRTRLFIPVGEGNRFEPIHRQVAEFLAGLFLGGWVEARHVSPARLRVLMAGADGTVAPSLRGLAAWIAVYSPRARPGLIRDDPIGMAIYGDTSEFGPEDQKQLMLRLRNRASEIDVWTWPSFALPSLATPGALPVVQDIIVSPERDDESQRLGYLALLALAHAKGSVVPAGLRETLLSVARDQSWLPGSRAVALKAWIASMPADERQVAEANELLDEIHGRRISDPRGSLTGLLLGYLFPRYVTPERLWDHAPTVAPEVSDSLHVNFWARELPRLSEEAECLTDVLDSLTRRLRDSRQRIDDSAIHRGVVNTFVRALERHGAQMETDRLYDWFTLVFSWIPSKSDVELFARLRISAGVSEPPADDGARINAWLQSHPDTQRALILELIRQRPDIQIIHPMDSPTIDHILAGAPATDFALWFLEQAESLSESRPQSACHLLFRAVAGTGALTELRDHQGMALAGLPDPLRMAWEKEAGATGSQPAGQVINGLTLDEVRRRISGHSALEECLESLLAPSPQPTPKPPLVEKRIRRRREWINLVREQSDALGRGDCFPSILYEVAKAYLGTNRSINGSTPEERLRDLFLGDEELRHTAQSGIGRVAQRSDLPTPEDLIQLEEDGKISYFVLPLLAYMEELERTDNGSPTYLQGEELQRAVAYYFFAREYGGSSPVWYRRALRSNAKDVAEAFVRVYRSRIRQDAGVDEHLRSLTRDDSHAQVARLAIPRLLKSFPAKATAAQAFYLDNLIPAALKHLDRDELASIVRYKLESSSLRIGHRVRWLATGMLLGDQQSGTHLDRFLAEGSDVRVQELAAFLRQLPALPTRVRSLSAKDLGMLVQRLGGYFVPHSAGAPGYISHREVEAIQTGGVVQVVLKGLSRRPSPAATELIQALVDDDDLAAWRRAITEARDIQRLARLDAEFVPPTIPDVLSVLEGGRPASAADLAALVVDRVVAIGERVRDGNANMWRHFWNEGRWGVSESPKTEPSCRDALLSALRPDLPGGVSVEKEASHAGDRKADLQVSFGDFAVPVETKLSSSRDLWTAIETQLIPRYTRDPRSGGHGVYVVFWHGAEDAKRPTPKGRPPRTAPELQDRLIRELDPAVLQKVGVIVLDVSPP